MLGLPQFILLVHDLAIRTAFLFGGDRFSAFETIYNHEVESI